MDSREQSVWVFRHIGPPPTIAVSAEVIELKPGPMVFGRGGAADIYIDSKVLHNFISRCHAVVEGKRDDAGQLHFTVYNHGLNGTYINDVRMGDVQQLKEGDTIIFGHKNGYKVKVGETAIQPDSEFQFVFERHHSAKSSYTPLQEHRQQEETNGGEATLLAGEHSDPPTYTPRRNPPTLTREATQQYNRGVPTKKKTGNAGQAHSESPSKRAGPQSRPDHLSATKDKISDSAKASPKDPSAPTRKVFPNDATVLGKGSAKDRGIAGKGCVQDASVAHHQPKAEEVCAAKENKERLKIVQSRNLSHDGVSTSLQRRPGKDSLTQKSPRENQHDARPASPKSHPSAVQHSHKQVVKSSQQRERLLQGTDHQSGSPETSRSPRPTGRSRPSSRQGSDSEYRSRSPLRGESSGRSLSPHRSPVGRSSGSDSDSESDGYDEPPVLSPEAEYIRTPSLRSHSPCSERGSGDESSDEVDDLDRDSEPCNTPLTPGCSLGDLSPGPHHGRGNSSPHARNNRRPSPGEASPRRNDNSWNRGEAGFGRNQKGGKRSVSPFLAGHRGKEAEAACVSHSRRDGSTAANNHKHWGKASSGPQHSTMEPDSTTVPKERNIVSSESSNGRLKTPKRSGGDWAEDSDSRFSAHQRICERSEDNDGRLKTQRRAGDNISGKSVDRLKTNKRASGDHRLDDEDGEVFKAHVSVNSSQRTKDVSGSLKTQRTATADRQSDDSSVVRMKTQNKSVEEQTKNKRAWGSEVRGVDREPMFHNGQGRMGDSRGARGKDSSPPSTRNVFDDFSSDVLDSTWHVVAKRTHSSGSEVSGDDSSRPSPKSTKLHQQSHKSFGEKENGVMASYGVSSVSTSQADKRKDYRQYDGKLLKDVRVSVHRVSSSIQSSGGLDRNKLLSQQPKGGKPGSRGNSDRREPAMDTSLFGLEMERLGSMRPKDKGRTSKTQPDKGSKLGGSQTPKATVSSSEKQRDRKSFKEKTTAPSRSQAPHTQASSRAASSDLSRPCRKVAVRRPREVKDSSEGHKSPQRPAQRSGGGGGGDERDSKKPRQPSSKRRKRQRKRAETEDEEEEDEYLEDGVVWYDGESCESSDCMRPADRRVQWVCCDDCDKWYHTVCVGIMNLEELADEEDYHCGCAD